jgi:DNA-binding transcriptional regulator YiaG
MTPNDPSSATRPAGRHDCNSDAMAGFAAAHGLARLTFTQRSIEAPLPPQNQRLWRNKTDPAHVHGAGQIIVFARKRKGFTQRQLAAVSGIHRKWLGRWERGRALPTQTEWNILAGLVSLPPSMPES